ncbi:MAG: serine/threonine-protein phosphatase [Prevotella sp.]|jgi:protein phosphatase|nr:serine/threonine-protein phosphatase [Prevotella sp.]
MSKIVLTAASRVGNVRSNNEDMILAFDRFIRSDIYQTVLAPENLDRFIVAVADGMGGHNAGEVASELVMQNLKFYVKDLPKGLSSGELEEAINDWLQSVHQTVNARGRVNKSMSDMGTTLVGLLYYGKRYFWMNCGDSRLYRLRDGQLEQITTDHSLINAEGEKKHSNVITNCIGAGCDDTFIDMIEFTDDFKIGDTYVLCSDGLNDMVPDVIIARMLQEGATANDLCEEAIAAGGYDNVSVCVLRVENQ